MSKPDITALALRLAAVFIWLEALSTAVWSLQLVGRGADEQFASDAFLGFVQSTAIKVAAGAVLFLWAASLARRIASRPDVDPSETRSAAGALALRLMGIVVLIWTLDLVPGVLSELRHGDREPPALYTGHVAAWLTLAALGTLLIVSARALSRTLLRVRPPDTTDARMARMQAIAFSIVGLWIFAAALPVLVIHIAAASSAYVERLQGLRSAFDRPHWPTEAWMALVQVLLGAGLFFGSRGLSSLWFRVRHAGVDAASREPRNEPV